ncbi:MAG: hypothetical protein IPK70_11615 [Flavobacteriales bacterium]|nr:hypothetical protein [Flavobacteriales bacterium]
MLLRLVPSFALAVSLHSAACQSPPWERPLMQAWSSDGIIFSSPAIFQDSSGVPSVIRWRGDTLIAAFQWFRQPNPSPSWDRVAVKLSYDNGANWTVPEPIVINGFPATYQRPFDPTLALLGGDSLRIYFSSSEGMPPMGLDSMVNTYSAVSTDGITYQFEPGARVDVLDNRVIDPAVIRFGPGWHYAAPAGAPQDGAYHFLSPNGIDFNAGPLIPSDAMHNWTGNYMVESPTELRFYGAGQNGVWYNSSPNGGQWNGYVSTNIMGGDPSVVKVADNSYLMVYVGPPYATVAVDESTDPHLTRVAPVPARDRLRILGHATIRHYRIRSLTGQCVQEGEPVAGGITLDGIPVGAYLLELTDADGTRMALRFVIE